jgi:hypothetical protein
VASWWEKKIVRCAVGTVGAVEEAESNRKGEKHQTMWEGREVIVGSVREDSEARYAACG